MNKNIIISVLIIIILGLGGFYLFKEEPQKLEGTNTSSSFLEKGINTTEATSSPTYMTPGTATTTLTVSKDKGSVLSLFVAFTASTSPAILNWDYQFSNNGVDWYEEDNVIDPTTLALLARFDHASTTVTHAWSPQSSTASTSYKVIDMPDTPSKFSRVRFTVPVGTVNSSIYAEIVK